MFNGSVSQSQTADEAMLTSQCKVLILNPKGNKTKIPKGDETKTPPKYYVAE